MRKLLLLLVVYCSFFAIGYSTFGQDDGDSPPANPCWGSDKPCPDGKFRDRQGKEQPASCDNMPKTGSAATHECQCERTEQCARPGKEIYMSAKCSVYCRVHDCHCIRDCS